MVFYSDFVCFTYLEVPVSLKFFIKFILMAVQFSDVRLG